MTDGYTGYAKLANIEGVEHLVCLAHVRRSVFDVHGAIGSPVAEEALGRVGLGISYAGSLEFSSRLKVVKKSWPSNFASPSLDGRAHRFVVLRDRKPWKVALHE